MLETSFLESPEGVDYFDIDFAENDRNQDNEILDEGNLEVFDDERSDFILRKATANPMNLIPPIKTEEILQIHNIDDFNQLVKENRKLINRLPEDYVKGRDDFLCPMFPFCNCRFENIEGLCLHIVINHGKDEEENDLSKDLVAIFDDLKFQMMKDYYNRKEDIGREFNKNSREEFFKERQKFMNKIGKNKELLELITTNDTIRKAIMFLIVALGKKPSINNLCTELNTDTFIVVKRGVHYNEAMDITEELDKCNRIDVNILRRIMNDKINTNNFIPSWIGVSNDPNIGRSTPIALNDGGLIVSRGQLKLIDGKAVVNRNGVDVYDGNTDLYDSEKIIPEVFGEIPKAAPFLVSDILKDDFSSERNKNKSYLDFLMVIFNIVKRLGIMIDTRESIIKELLARIPSFEVPEVIQRNIDINIPRINCKVIDYDFEVPKIKLSFKEEKIDMKIPTLNPIKRELDYPIPVLNPIRSDLPFPIPILNPINREVDFQIPSFKPTEKDINVQVPNLQVIEKEVKVNVPQIHTAVENIDYKIPLLNPVQNQINCPIPIINPTRNQVEYPIPVMNPIKNQINCPIPIMNPTENQIEYPIPMMNPVKKQIDFPVPMMNPVPNQIDYSIPLLNPVQNSIECPIPILNPIQNQISYPIPMIKPEIFTQKMETMIQIPSIEVKENKMEMKIPMFNFVREEIPIKIQIPKIIFEVSGDGNAMNRIEPPDAREGIHNNINNNSINNEVVSNSQASNGYTPERTNDSAPPERNDNGRMEENGNSRPLPTDLYNELKLVNDLSDIEKIIDKWGKITIPNLSDWGSDLDPVDNPIVNNIAISKRWPGPGKFICPYCLNFSANVYSKLTNHIQKKHEDQKDDNRGFWLNKVFASIVGRKKYFIIKTSGRVDIAVENIYSCLDIECNKFTNTKANFHSHLCTHKELSQEVKKLGMFWGTICYWMKRDVPIKTSDIFKEQKGIRCPLCDDFYSNMKNSYTHHLRTHKDMRRENSIRPAAISIDMYPMIIGDEERERRL